MPFTCLQPSFIRSGGAQTPSLTWDSCKSGEFYTQEGVATRCLYSICNAIAFESAFNLHETLALSMRSTKELQPQLLGPGDFIPDPLPGIVPGPHVVPLATDFGSTWMKIYGAAPLRPRILRTVYRSNGHPSPFFSFLLSIAFSRFISAQAVMLLVTLTLIQ